MSIELLRWKGGAGGDTILHCLLMSNPSWQSQVSYVGLDHATTKIDKISMPWPGFEQISKMAGLDYLAIDPVLLANQLQTLDERDPLTNWKLKTHCYIDFDWPVVDIIISLKLLPFMIKANLTKNSRQMGKMSNYHSMASKIRDPHALYKFDCYNMVKDALPVTKPFSNNFIWVDDLLQDWHRVREICQTFGWSLSCHAQSYYEQWRQNNQHLLPSSQYQTMIENKQYDWHHSALSIEEKDCLLVIQGGKFQLL